LGQAAPALFTLAQRLLGELEPRDVAGDAERADDRAVLVAEGHLGRGDPAQAAVEPYLLLFFAYQRPARAHDLLFILVSRPGMFLGEEVEIRLADRRSGISEAETSS